MSRQKIEDEALHLPRQERAKLAQRLLLSLDDPSSDELRAEWLEEAQRRAEELDRGSVKPVPADEVLTKARSLTE
ncbi:MULTISPECIES: addiction module protein [unclassified Wenzhouxiangella]|uniref:addiction module protein n=1 Tax=unclassified Wenzhouxiangella TaxID=2613841 RepID=UPI000E32BD18|nr:MULTISPECIES: addiction module protein [unclassified Wenzhouxiangella]RFF27797.1 addiction module antitoxin RelB [Wenzhouxiangella sp. 15181]RFP70360.1 addiction module antitoxin RelB [Wenzhouxiangella sp. 15190]